MFKECNESELQTIEGGMVGYIILSNALLAAVLIHIGYSNGKDSVK